MGEVRLVALERAEEEEELGLINLGRRKVQQFGDECCSLVGARLLVCDDAISSTDGGIGSNEAVSGMLDIMDAC
jgi:hypothetical protein